MAFILLSRDGSEVRLLDPAVFETRQQALSAIARNGSLADTEEVFVVDLDAATPVLIVPQHTPASLEPEAPAEVAPEPDAAAGAWETPEPVVVEPVDVEPAAVPVDEPEAEPVIEIDEPEVEPVIEIDEPEVEIEPEPEAENDDLADAIRRAAGALESTGIVAPESVPAAPVALDEAPTAEPSPVPPAEQVTEQAPASWPWDMSTDATPEPAPAPESEDLDAPDEESFEPVSAEVEEPAPVYVPDPFEEPARDVEDLVHGDGGDETIALSRPVIMGAYSSTDGPVAERIEAPTDDAEEPTGLLDDLQDIAERTADDPVSEEEPSESGAYEPGASDIAELTCDECVYLNTCPKKGESDPSSCGSFQWKTV